MLQFSAKLLFQYKILFSKSKFNKMRTCEERIIILKANDLKSAISKANHRGKKANYTYFNNDGNKVSFEFIGIRDMIHLGLEVEKDEVWYDIKQYLLPSERKDKLILTNKQLIKKLNG